MIKRINQQALGGNMNSLKKFLIVSIVSISSVTSLNLNAACARCAQIEAERAKDQAEHPQSNQYYDESYKNEITLVDTNTTAPIYQKNAIPPNTRAE